MDEEQQCSMSVHIILPEDDSNGNKPARCSPVRHCGEEISGRLEVIASSDFMFDIDLSFEGYSRNFALSHLLLNNI